MYVANSSEMLFFPVQMRNSKHDIDDIWLQEITFGVDKFKYICIEKDVIQCA